LDLGRLGSLVEPGGRWENEVNEAGEEHQRNHQRQHNTSRDVRNEYQRWM